MKNPELKEIGNRLLNIMNDFLSYLNKGLKDSVYNSTNYDAKLNQASYQAAVGAPKTIMDQAISDILDNNSRRTFKEGYANQLLEYTKTLLTRTLSLRDQVDSHLTGSQWSKKELDAHKIISDYYSQLDTVKTQLAELVTPKDECELVEGDDFVVINSQFELDAQQQRFFSDPGCSGSSAPVPGSGKSNR